MAIMPVFQTGDVVSTTTSCSRRYGAMVSTSGFQPENTGSIPVIVTELLECRLMVRTRSLYLRKNGSIPFTPTYCRIVEWLEHYPDKVVNMVRFHVWQLGAWDCKVWSSVLQSEYQSGSIPESSTKLFCLIELFNYF